MHPKRAWQAAVLATLALPGAPLLEADDGDVRPLQARGTRVLEEGIRRSPTLSRLVSELRESDVVVYLDLDPNEAGLLEGSLRFRGAVGGARYVRAWLQPRRSDDTLIAMLAHELQHAVEVARAADVRSPETFKAWYAAVGRSGTVDRYETDAAQAIGARVRRELERASGGRQ